MTAHLNATEAVLACAAAETSAEMHAARLALIDNGAAILHDIDRSLLLAGSGDAGVHLLGGVGSPMHDSAAQRAARLLIRLDKGQV